MAALARLNSDCTSAASGLSLGSKSDNNGSKMGLSGDRLDDVSKPRTGCWADMIAPFAEKMPGKRMPKTGKIGPPPLHSAYLERQTTNLPSLLPSPNELCGKSQIKK